MIKTTVISALAATLIETSRPPLEALGLWQAPASPPPGLIAGFFMGAVRTRGR
jgi:hypothetical protein